ncbi:MAG: hypothetical protein R6V55_04690 [Desulfovermiculus sp.]
MVRPWRLGFSGHICAGKRIANFGAIAGHCLGISFASGKSEIFLPQSGQKNEKFAGLIRYETRGGPFPPSLPGPDLSNTPGSDSPGNRVLRLKNIASIFGNRFYFIYKFLKFEYRNPKFETIGTNDLKK